MGRENDRAVAPAQERGSVVEAAQREQAVAVDQHRHRRLGHQAAHAGNGGRRAPETRPDDEGPEAPEVGQHRVGPTLRRQGEPGGLGGRKVGGVDPRAAEAHVTRSAPQGGACAQRGGTGHAGRPGDDPHRSLPLVRVSRSHRDPEGDVASLHDVGACARHVEADVDQLGHPGPLRTVGEQEARLEGGEGDRRVGPHRVVARLTREAVDAGWNVDRENRCAERVGRAVVAVEARAEGGVDDEVARRHLACVGRGVEQVDAYPAAPKPGGRGAAVGAVVPLAGDNRHAPAVGTAEHRERPPRHRRPGPLDEHLDRLGRGRVDRLHLLRRENGDHVAAARTAEGGDTAQL